MAFTTSPNMNLIIPGVGTETGPQWASDVNNSLTLIDAHNHAPGYGVQINPSGLNINSDLTFNTNNAITLRSTRFISQSAVLSLPTDIGCLYVVGNELYYNDVTGGHNVQLTSGGTVNATSSGISSGTATASFSGSTLVVNSSSNTPANIQFASAVMGNSGVANSNYCTLSVPNSLAANYNLTLPLASGSGIQLLTIDTSGNIVANPGTVSATVANNIGVAMTATGANAVANSRTRPVGNPTEAVGGVCQSTVTSFSTTSTSPANVTSVTLTTSGRPVVLTISGNYGTTSFCELTNSTSSGFMQFVLVGLSQVQTFEFTNQTNTGAPYRLPPSAFQCMFAPSSGTYTFNLNAFVGNSATALVLQNITLVAYEI